VGSWWGFAGENRLWFDPFCCTSRGTAQCSRFFFPWNKEIWLCASRGCEEWRSSSGFKCDTTQISLSYFRTWRKKKEQRGTPDHVLWVPGAWACSRRLLEGNPLLRVVLPESGRLRSLRPPRSRAPPSQVRGHAATTVKLFRFGFIHQKLGKPRGNLGRRVGNNSWWLFSLFPTFLADDRLPLVLAAARCCSLCRRRLGRLCQSFRVRPWGVCVQRGRSPKKPQSRPNLAGFAENPCWGGSTALSQHPFGISKRLWQRLLRIPRVQRKSAGAAFLFLPAPCPVFLGDLCRGERFGASPEDPFLAVRLPPHVPQPLSVSKTSFLPSFLPRSASNQTQGNAGWVQFWPRPLGRSFPRGCWDRCDSFGTKAGAWGHPAPALKSPPLPWHRNAERANEHVP